MDIARPGRLRQRCTEAETALWDRLRNRGLNGAKFRRQVPLGPFVVDFACFDARLVVEVDGGQHAASQQQDVQRTTWLEAQGYRVVRFWNNEVLENIEGVLQTIAANLESE
jgi:very-short-patch-repair endonuclease